MTSTTPVSASSAVSALLNATETAAKTGSNSLATSASTTASTASAGAFASLAGNENEFLTLLTTQLKHQDPSKPADTSDMTSELAQFANVEQSVQTNTNLTRLISLQAEGQLTTDKAMVGQTASVSTNTLPLQNGSASLSFSAVSGEIVGVSVANSAGQVVKDDVVESSSGTNTWKWDGKDNSGNTMPDGAYSVSVKTVDSGGTTSDVAFNVNGTITGVTKGANDIYIKMGGAVVPMADVSTVSSTSAAS
ncbi:flagellar hook assembly protein FlgD [Acetobacter malorum]|nr:flagellar hook capping FlgD N-terminal domain-containing protein [Acetobacter malorum]KXV06486.1 flagellar biosynthesis protein FlgD [Acetobacter malorum]